MSAAEHREIVEDFCDFLSGRTDRLVRQLETRMQEAAEDLDFETAARLRDDVGALKKALEKQAVVLGDGTDADLVAFASDELEVAVQVFHVRGGRVRGQRGWVVEKAGDVIERDAVAADAGAESELALLVEQFLTQFYGEQAALSDSGAAADQPTNAVPREVLVPALPRDVEGLQQWLGGLRGSSVKLRVPQRGDKKALAETVERNAKEALAQHKLRRAGDFTSRSAALQGIQEALDLDSAPLRIECVDISHVQGTDVVASLVVFEDGLPRKSDYRHYAIREAAGDGRSDDVASIAEVTRRRFLRHNRDVAAGGGADGGDQAPEAALDPQTGRPRRFAYPPNLFVVDGGSPQVNAAAEVLDELGVTDVAVIGLAKRLEEVWVPGEEDPVILPRTSESLYLLQRIRDEAHRFAITFHRSKRSRRMTASALDSVRGLGETRRTALVTHFGSVAKLREATVEEITAVPGIGVSHRAGRARGARRTQSDRTAAVAAAETSADVDAGRHGRGGDDVTESAPRKEQDTVARERPAERGGADVEVSARHGSFGAGLSTAAKVLEDLGWYVVDNLPPETVTRMVELGVESDPPIRRLRCRRRRHAAPPSQVTWGRSSPALEASRCRSGCSPRGPTLPC